MLAARELVERAAHGTSEHTYGVNTGFGRFVNRSIPEELTEELQLRLLRSHACGVGEPYADEIVRAAMLLRANTLAKGNSGSRVRAVARGAPGLSHLVPAADPCAAAAPRAGRRGSERAAAARGLRDHRVAPLVRQGSGCVLASLRPTGARRVAGSPRLRRLHGLRRAERCNGQPARARRRRHARLERELPRPAARVRARCACDGGLRA